jgi:hypothetical protein
MACVEGAGCACLAADADSAERLLSCARAGGAPDEPCSRCSPWCSRLSRRDDQVTLVDDARRLVDEADFAAAERAFATAEAASDLSRADLVALLEGRSLLHHALADGAALEADLARLAALDPGHTFGPRMPPEIADAFLRVRTRSAGALRVDVQMRPVPGGPALSATTANDPGGLVRALEVHARVAGGPWRTAPDELVLTGAPGAGVELWAVARGPGGEGLGWDQGAQIGQGHAQDFFEPAAVVQDLRLAVEGAAQDPQDVRGVRVVPGVTERVVDPAAFPAVLDETRRLEQRQVLRDGRRGKPQHGLDLADAQLAVFDELEDPGPGRVPGGLQGGFELTHDWLLHFARWRTIAVTAGGVH